MTNGLLYRWPASAKLGRVVPKSKIYNRAAVSTTVRSKFTTQVQRITWAYKLAEETVRLHGDVAVPEIQVFTIDARDEDVSDDVLTAIDKAVQFPIIFEIKRVSADQASIRMAASYKQLDGSIPRLSPYFTTDWQPADAFRLPLPLALDLHRLYAGILAPILPVRPRLGETLAETLERIGQVRKMERQIATLEKSLRVEVQLNRKVEMRRVLRDQLATIDALLSATRTDHVTADSEDVSWTN